jgi:hypothetical protein
MYIVNPINQMTIPMLCYCNSLDTFVEALLMFLKANQQIILQGKKQKKSVVGFQLSLANRFFPVLKMYHRYYFLNKNLHWKSNFKRSLLGVGGPISRVHNLDVDTHVEVAMYEESFPEETKDRLVEKLDLLIWSFSQTKLGCWCRPLMMMGEPVNT